MMMTGIVSAKERGIGCYIDLANSKVAVLLKRFEHLFCLITQMASILAIKNHVVLTLVLCIWKEALEKLHVRAPHFQTSVRPILHNGPRTFLTLDWPVQLYRDIGGERLFTVKLPPAPI